MLPEIAIKQYFKLKLTTFKMKNHPCLRITLFTFILLFSGISHYASAKQKFRANTSGDGFPFYTKLVTGETAIMIV